MVGALLAIPVAGAAQVIVRHLLIDPTIRKRTLRTEEGVVIVSDEEEEEPAVVSSTIQVPGQPGNGPQT